MVVEEPRAGAGIGARITVVEIGGGGGTEFEPSGAGGEDAIVDDFAGSDDDGGAGEPAGLLEPGNVGVTKAKGEKFTVVLDRTLFRSMVAMPKPII